MVLRTEAISNGDLLKKIEGRAKLEEVEAEIQLLKLLMKGFKVNG